MLDKYLKPNRVMRAFTLLLASVVFAGCSENAEEMMPDGRLKIEVTASSVHSKAVIETQTLPDGQLIGLSLVDNGGKTYDNITYQNIKAGSSTGKTPQVWTLEQTPMLSNTAGTLYGYYPWQSSTQNFKVQVDATLQTDYMYTEPVTGLDITNATATVTMKHALAALRFKVVKGTYSGKGKLTGLSIQGSQVARTGEMDMRTGALSTFTGTSTEMIVPVNTILTAQGTQHDVIFVPVTSVNDKLTIKAELDDNPFTVSIDKISFQQGHIYNLTLTFNNKGASLSNVKVDNWAYTDAGNLTVN